MVLWGSLHQDSFGRLTGFVSVLRSDGFRLAALSRFGVVYFVQPHGIAFRKFRKQATGVDYRLGLAWNSVMELGIQGAGSGHRWFPIAVVVLLLALVASKAEAIEIPFEAAWDRVRQEHGIIRAAELDRQRLERLETATRSLFLPQVNLEGRYTRLNDPIRIELGPTLESFPGFPSNLPPLGLTVQDDEFWKLSVSAVWPVYTGGRVRAARNAASAELEAATEAVRQTLHALHSDLIQRYFAVPMAGQVVVAREAALAGAEHHFENARRLEEEGLISAVERLHAEVARAEADREARHARRQWDIARTALALFLQMESDLMPSTPLPEPDAALIPAASRLRARAVRDHPALNRLEAQRRQAVEGVRAERGKLHPEVFAFGRRELATADLTLLEPEWAVGIGINLPLLDRSDRLNRMRAARLRERQIEALAEQVARDLETLIESRVLEVKQAVEHYETLASSLGLARENLRVRERAFAEGMSSSLEVTDARNRLVEVETALVVTRYQYVLKSALLYEAAGSLEGFTTLLGFGPNLDSP